MDIHADPKLRDRVSPFVQMLWRRGRAHEDEVIATNRARGALNLRMKPVEDRERLTFDAMRRREALIYGGRISAADLLGEPDLLRFEDGKYVPGDIKSGAGEEGPDGTERKLKVHYGVQLALYVDVLERLDFSAGRRGFIWDVHGDEIQYDLTIQRGPKSPSIWDSYQDDLLIAREIIADATPSKPAYASGTCKQCWWLAECLKQLERSDDLTLIPELGRNRRDPLSAHVATISDFAARPLETFINDKGKSAIVGFSTDSLQKFQARAIMRASGGTPYLKAELTIPTHPIQLFFDIETDPSRDHCYLHGFVERHNGENASEKFFSFFSSEPTMKGEHDAFAEAWNYVSSRRPCAIFIYSKYERTWWRNLQKRYPDICSSDDIDTLFASPDMIDLYEIVSKQTEWPTIDFSLKTLAKFLGFAWRDAHPSGAESIEWFERFVDGDPDAKARILAYNEDDCRATRVLLDGILALQLNQGLYTAQPMTQPQKD